MNNDVNRILNENYLVRKTMGLDDKHGIIKFSCPNCDEEVISDYFYENKKLIGTVECKNCKVMLIINF